jgi:chorismate mutase
MTAESVPAELLEVREKIDAIDADLLNLLAARFALTYRVGVLKADKALKAMDAGREAQKLADLRALSAQHNLNPDLVAELFTKIMEEVVRNHQQLRNPET